MRLHLIDSFQANEFRDQIGAPVSVMWSAQQPRKIRPYMRSDHKCRTILHYLLTPWKSGN